METRPTRHASKRKYPAIFESATAHDKLRLIDFDFSLATDGILVLLLAGIFANLIPYTSDQAVVQRYLTTKDERTARIAASICSTDLIPSSRK